MEVEDDLLNLIYRLREKSVYDLSALYSIDPYADAFIDFDQVKKIREICTYLLFELEISHIPDQKNMTDSLTELLDLANTAILQRKGLVSIGD